VQSARCPVSIICVFNNVSVRERCLDRSIERHRSEVEDLDYVLIDNRDGSIPSAGAALNVGASRARHDHLVFVHQDVVLHSLTALERAAAVLEADHGIGLVGAFGVSRPLGSVGASGCVSTTRTLGSTVEIFSSTRATEAPAALAT
jgi:hypothetical protein